VSKFTISDGRADTKKKTTEFRRRNQELRIRIQDGSRQTADGSSQMSARKFFDDSLLPTVGCLLLPPATSCRLLPAALQNCLPVAKFHFVGSQNVQFCEKSHSCQFSV
jgi:hypothetical protein